MSAPVSLRSRQGRVIPTMENEIKPPLEQDVNLPIPAPAGMVPMHERRQHERRVLRTPAKLQFGNQPAMDARTLDVSVSGLGLVAPVNPPQGTPCSVKFAVPTQADRFVTLSAQAVVTYSVYVRNEDGFKLGLMFSDLPFEAGAVILRYVKRFSTAT